MPLKPPSNAITRMMRMIVPSDINFSSARQSAPVAQPSAGETNRKSESSVFRAANAALCFSEDAELNALTRKEESKDVRTFDRFDSAQPWPRRGNPPSQGRADPCRFQHPGFEG